MGKNFTSFSVQIARNPWLGKLLNQMQQYRVVQNVTYHEKRSSTLSMVLNTAWNGDSVCLFLQFWIHILFLVLESIQGGEFSYFHSITLMAILLKNIPTGPSEANPSISSVQLSHSVWLFAVPWTAARQASLSITNSQNLPKLMYIESVMPSNNLILLSPSPPASNLAQHQGLFNESALRIRWPKYWSFSFNITPSNEHPGLISFRVD